MLKLICWLIAFIFLLDLVFVEFFLTDLPVLPVLQDAFQLLIEILIMVPSFIFLLLIWSRRIVVKDGVK